MSRLWRVTLLIGCDRCDKTAEFVATHDKECRGLADAAGWWLRRGRALDLCPECAPTPAGNRAATPEAK